MGKALFLSEPSEHIFADRIKNILAVFGVECDRMTTADFLATRGDDKARLFASAGTFLQLAEGLEKINTDAVCWWRKKVHSAFVFGGNDTASLLDLAKRITGDAASLAQVDPGSDWIVSNNQTEYCKSMDGIRVAAALNGAGIALVFDESKSNAAKIIFGPNGTAFCRLEFHSVSLFLSIADIIDVDVPLPGRNFDIRPNFLSAVPVVLYVKWAFAETCWQPPETCACLVIDDPLLRPRYGYLNFQQLHRLMERLNFATSIAFIPWNWNRSAQETVRLFQGNPKRFSLSIHGCDHTGGEFGSRNRLRLVWKSRQAIQRMMRHHSITGLSFDRVMVFPQGVFSEETMGVLKQSDFIGVVNSEVISTETQPRNIKISDCWNVAVMNYSDFPIFTRRYPWQGVENFAFDVLLGKPCIVVVHHDDFHDDCRHVVEFIERLNKLNVRLQWCNLAEVVRRSVRKREYSSGVVDVEMYGIEARVDNSSDQKKIFRIRKRESAPLTIREIRATTQPVNWIAAENHIIFEIDLNPGEIKTVTIAFKELEENEFKGESLLYKTKAMLRRYLCELRDNYIMRKSFS